MGALGGIILVVGWIVALVGSIMVLIAAFKESIVWGLLSLFVPVVILIFALTHWAESKKGVFFWIGGIILLVVGGVIAGMGAAAG